MHLMKRALAQQHDVLQVLPDERALKDVEVGEATTARLEPLVEAALC
jgi:hypothetical protein